MGSVRIDFPEVALTGRKTCSCSVCGKTLRRQKKFWQTISTFNRTADGVPKSAAQIRLELQAAIEDWMTEPESCRGCEGGSRWEPTTQDDLPPRNIP